MTELTVSSPKLNCVKSCRKLSSEKASGRNVGGIRLISASGLKALSTIQAIGRSRITMSDREPDRRRVGIAPQASPPHRRYALRWRVRRLAPMIPEMTMAITASAEASPKCRLTKAVRQM